MSRTGVYLYIDAINEALPTAHGEARNIEETKELSEDEMTTIP